MIQLKGTFVSGTLEWSFKATYVRLRWKKMNLLDILACLPHITGTCACIHEGYKDKFNSSTSSKLIK